MSVQRIDLSGFVANAGAELTPWQRQLLSALPDGSISVAFDNANARYVPSEPLTPIEYRPARRHPVAYRGQLRWTGEVARFVGPVRRVDTAALRRMHVEYSRRLRARRRRA